MIRRGLYALALLLAASCGRPASETSEVRAEPTPLPIEMADVGRRPPPAARARPPVIWIGLDGLDWEILDRLSAAGRMPHWARLVAEGHAGRLEAFQPLISPLLWTTAATGVDPTVHGVLDFQEVEPRTGRKLPISGHSRAVPAVWNVASAQGKKVGVVGWWATHPAEEVEGFFVSDRLAPLLFPEAPGGGLAYPSLLAGGIAQVRPREAAVTDEELAGFVRAPVAEVRRLRAAAGGPVDSLARVIGATRLSHRVARDLYDRQRPDLMVLYMAGTDEIGHLFAPYMPPKLDCVSEEDVLRYGGAVDDYYALVDRILGQWVRRAQEDGATLLVHSDHGFLWGQGRPCDVGAHNWNTATFWHRPQGVFLAWGRRVRTGRAPAPMSLFDVAPTVSALLEIPVDSSVRGQPPASAFVDLLPSRRRALFPEVEVRRLPSAPLSDAEADEYAKKLIALGYISGADTRTVAPAPGERPGRTEGAWNNLGLYYRETARDAEAARRAFEKSLEVRGDYASPMFSLAVLARRNRDAATAETWLWRSIDAGYPDPDGALLNWAIEDLRAGRVARGKKLLERAVGRYADSERLAQQLAFVRFQERDCGGAAGALSRFEAATRQPDTLNSLAMYRACLGSRAEAIALLQRSLAARPDQPEARESLRKLQAASP